jgi:hypothetical protein
VGGGEGGGVGGGGGDGGERARRRRAHEPAEEGSAFYPPFLSLSPHSVRWFEALNFDGLHFLFLYLITFELSLCVLRLLGLPLLRNLMYKRSNRELMLMLSS